MNNKMWLIIGIPLCIIFSVFFIVKGMSLSSPVKGSQALNTSWYKRELPRETLVDNAVIVGNCWVCHAMWTSIPQLSRLPVRFVHPEVKLNHGKNNRCFNCHLESNRNKYTSDDGITGIMHTNVEELCGRCHGTIYKKWKDGIHGARRGRWMVKGRFDRINFKCTYCHDPHSPRYEYKNFAPAPAWDYKFIRLVLSPGLDNQPYSLYFPPASNRESNGRNHK